MTLPTVLSARPRYSVSIRSAATRYRTFMPRSTARDAAAHQGVALARAAGGPIRSKFSLARTHSSDAMYSKVGRGIDESATLKASRVLGTGNPACLRRMRRLAASRAAISA